MRVLQCPTRSIYYRRTRHAQEVPDIYIDCDLIFIDFEVEWKILFAWLLGTPAHLQNLLCFCVVSKAFRIDKVKRRKLLCSFVL